MHGPALDSTPNAQYIAAVERTEEMTRLLAQAHRRKSMLLFGPEGVGKTRLLQRFVKLQPLALYVDQTHAPRDLMLALVDNLRSLPKMGIHLPADPKSLSTSSLKGIVRRALDQHPFLLVLDQLSGPSRVVTGMIKEMNHYGRTPVIFAARTPHMEDIGTLLPMCADRSERTELKNLTSHIALEFARREAEKMELWAANLEDALSSFIEWSQGNPGSILQMLKMAQLPEYRIEDQIKAHVLYLDFRMGTANAQQFHA
ncbi:MAG: ATP-binding protein [Acidobacteriaceae bacterium]